MVFKFIKMLGFNRRFFPKVKNAKATDNCLHHLELHEACFDISYLNRCSFMIYKKHFYERNRSLNVFRAILSIEFERKS